MCPGEETIAAYAAGQLARAERDAVDSHLDTCSMCQELVAALAKLATVGAAVTITEEDLTAGGTLGRYVLLARLGAGGMGVVYAAYDPELDRRVAVKVLRRTRAGDALRDEARAIAKLAHPNVIAIHDVGEADGEVFIAMEHVDGETLREWLRTQRSANEILDAFVQAGRGLAAAHAAGLVHRDVKPSNIIVGTDGRARMLDFGLAHADADAQVGTIAGTPAYMAPEQKRGEKIDARADQYAFAVAVTEALKDLDVSERVTKALRRATSDAASDRFATLDELLAELSPPPMRLGRWIAAAIALVVVLVGALVFTATRHRVVPSCAKAGEPIAHVWNDWQKSAVRESFAQTRVPYAKGAASDASAKLDAWVARWRAQAEGTCKATVIDKVQPAATNALRTSCLDDLVAQLKPIVAVAMSADAEVVARASTLADALPAPERCADVAALVAVAPPPEAARLEIEALRAEIATYEAAFLAGRAEQVRAQVLAVQKRADATGYAPIRARAALLVGRMEISAAKYSEGITALHLAAQSATAARDLETLADVWIELSKALGNDLRTLDEAELFDGYAQALIGQLPDRDERTLELAFARCNRNVTAAQATHAGANCEQAIALAEKATPPRASLANAARARLGHFQRLQGNPEQALATLRATVDEAVALHGAQHPEVAIAHYVLGIALIDGEDYEHGIAELRTALAIREAVFPAGNVQVAESLIGLGDALGASGKLDESVASIEKGLAILEAAHQGESAHAANAHILAGMSLQELKRPDDALAHFIRGADIADRSLEHREAIVAMGLRLAASIEIDREHYAAAVPHLERAIRVLERGKAAPAELGKTQFALGQVLYELGPVERDKAKAMVSAARASYLAAGTAGAAGVTEIDAFVRSK